MSDHPLFICSFTCNMYWDAVLITLQKSSTCLSTSSHFTSVCNFEKEGEDGG